MLIKKYLICVVADKPSMFSSFLLFQNDISSFIAMKSKIVCKIVTITVIPIKIGLFF